MHMYNSKVLLTNKVDDDQFLNSSWTDTYSDVVVPSICFYLLKRYRITCCTTNILTKGSTLMPCQKY